MKIIEELTNLKEKAERDSDRAWDEGDCGESDFQIARANAFAEAINLVSLWMIQSPRQK